MILLEKRVEKLEASQPKEDSQSHLTEAELDESIFLGIKQMHDEGLKLVPELSLMNVQCRQFYKDEPWIRYANHRISVFQGFRKIGFDRKMPNRVKQTFAQGWGNNKIDRKEISWIVKHLKDVDLGEETPWLKGYLECSGVVNEYHQNQFRSIDD